MAQRLRGQTFRVFGLALSVMALVAVLGGSAALASSGEDDVTIDIDGNTHAVEEGDVISVGQRLANGECSRLPDYEMQLSGSVSLAEVTFDHDLCALRVTRIEHGIVGPRVSDYQAAQTMERGATTYLRWRTRASATTRGLGYWEEFTRTRTQVKFWAPRLWESGPVVSGHHPQYDCYAWWRTSWRVVSCTDSGHSLSGPHSIWKRASGVYEFQWRGVFVHSWSKAEGRGYTTGSRRFVATCGFRGGYSRPWNYFRCERDYGLADFRDYGLADFEDSL